MRVLTIVGLVLVGEAAALSAQHAHQLEFGGFGSYTRYDPTFGLDNTIGGGVRLGYFLSDAFGLEVDAGMASPYATGSGGTVGTAAAFGSASLVLNSGGEHNILYVLGGYTRLRFGGYAPYTYVDEVHGGLGDRIFFGSRVALRLEARAYYAPGNQLGTGQTPLNITGSAGLSLFLFGGGGGQAEAPEIPKAKRDSIIAAGGTLPGGGAGTSAPHAHQLEFGGFGSYTRYDPTFGLDNTIGGGVRLGYFLSDAFGLEVDAGMASPYATGSGGTVGTAAAFQSASLVLNSGGEHNILYVLGGYTRLRFGGYSPYTYLNEVHGGLGDRIFFGRRVALRLEARAYYAPGDQLGTGQTPLNITGSAGLSLFLFGGGGGGQAEAPEIPKAKRDSIIAAGGTPPPTAKPTRQVFVEKGTDWAHQWFWGGQAGVLVFKTDADGLSAEPTFGGHWLITAKRTALYVAYEQSFFLTDRHATVLEPNNNVEPGNVAFRSLRRIMMGVLAFPVQKAVQPFGGAGFAILEVLNPVATCTNCSVSDAEITQANADYAATKAAFWWMGGIDVRQGRMVLYGHYILTSAVSSFLISGVTHTFQGGIRYSLGSAREDVTDEH